MLGTGDGKANKPEKTSAFPECCCTWMGWCRGREWIQAKACFLWDECGEGTRSDWWMLFTYKISLTGSGERSAETQGQSHENSMDVSDEA